MMPVSQPPSAHRPSQPPAELVKMSTLARRSGVPAATIKHYLREGLLPQPDVRTSKNMALYDARLVSRVKAIKELQRTKFLPLKVIKGVLDGIGPDTDAETAQAIQRALDEMAPIEARTRKQLLAAGVPAEELDFFRAIGLLTPEGPNGPLGDAQVAPDQEVYVGDDLQLLRVLGEARKAGITASMLPAAILEPYARAIRELVRTELRLFREGVIPLAGDDLGQITTIATRLSEQLVIVLRRKLLVPTLKQIALQAKNEQPSLTNAANRAAPSEPPPEPTRADTPAGTKAHGQTNPVTTAILPPAPLGVEGVPSFSAPAPKVPALSRREQASATKKASGTKKTAKKPARRG